MMVEDQVTCSFSVHANELARVLHNASLFVSKDQTRPIRTAVCITVDADDQGKASLTAAATDSYKLGSDTAVLLHTFTGYIDRLAGQWLLPADDLAPVLKALKTHAKTVHGDIAGAVRLTFAGDSWPARTITFDVGSESFRIICHAGDFPSWRQLIPTDEPTLEGGTITLDPSILATFAKVIGRSSFPKPHDTGIRLSFHGPEKAATVTLAPDADQSFFALVMPIRKR